MKAGQILQNISQLTRSKDWRLSFVPFIIGCTYLWIFIMDIQFDADSLIMWLLSIVTSIGFASLGYFINEFFDKKTDALAGKLNKLAFIHPLLQFGLFVILLLVTILPWFFLPSDALSFWLIGIEIMLFLVYSLPFPRLKNNPFVSGIIDASYAYVVPLVLSAHTYALFSGADLGVGIYFFSIGVFIVGGRNITIHHVNDIFKDKRSGIVTLPQRIGPTATNKMIRAMLVLETLFLLLSFIVVSLNFPLFWIWVSIYVFCLVYKIVAEHIDFESEHFCIEKGRHFPDFIYQIVFPVSILFLTLSSDFLWICVLPLHGVLLVSWELYKKPWHRFIWFIQNPLRGGVSACINYPIYFMFLLVGINLKAKNMSARQYIQSKFN